MGNKEQYVPEIRIATSSRPVSPLEIHLKAVRNILGDNIDEFATGCGINSVTYAVVENRNFASKKNANKIINRLGEISSLEGNPHAEAVVTILTLRHLNQPEKKFSANRYKTNQTRHKERIRELESLVEPYEGTIIFRDSERRQIILDKGIVVDLRGDQQKWENTLQQIQIGTAVTYIRCDRGLSQASFAKKNKLPLEKLKAIERKTELPSSEEIDAIVAHDAQLSKLFKQKAFELTHSKDTTQQTELVDPRLLELLTVQRTVGSTLRALREWNNLTQTELGGLISKTDRYIKQYISQVERGQRQLKDFLLANYLKKLGFDIHHPITQLLLEKQRMQSS